MRKIEQRMRSAVKNLKDFNESNTTVAVKKKDGGHVSVKVYLYDNCIFRYNDAEDIAEFNFCGWPTPTTASRLNALGCNVRIRPSVKEAYHGNESVNIKEWHEVEHWSYKKL